MGVRRLNEFGPVGAALFGATRQAVLRTFFSHPDERFYQRQVIQMIGLGSGAVQRELTQFTGARILTRTVEGRQTYYQANRECPVYEELHGLIRKTLGVAQVLKGALRSIAWQIRIAFVYGSVAAGIQTAASDIDVMLIGGNPSLQEVVSALMDAQRDLRREINPTVYGVEEFCRRLAEGQHFLSNVLKGPKIFLIGDDGELRRLAQVWMAQGAQDQPAGNRRSARRRRS